MLPRHRFIFPEDQQGQPTLTCPIEKNRPVIYHLFPRRFGNGPMLDCRLTIETVAVQNSVQNNQAFLTAGLCSLTLSCPGNGQGRIGKW